MRRVTFSRNFTLSLSRTCRCYCKYCSFATHQAHLHEPREVERLLDLALRRGAKELLVLTGERPEVNAEVSQRLAKHGHADFISYVAWACERALERGLLPHTNVGVLARDQLARLREVTASQGLMLESISDRLMTTVHAGSPSKHPERRLATIMAAGELAIPFTTGILVGIGETVGERIASLEAIAAAHDRHGHIQEVILQNYVAHPSYHGREPGEIADASQHAGNDRPPAGDLTAPSWASPVSLADMLLLVRECRRLMPDVAIQVPPNLSHWWLALVEAGASDLGGLSANGDHISPEHPFPSRHGMCKRLAARGYALSERLCVHARYLTPRWLDPAVFDLIRTRYPSFIPRDIAPAASRGPRSGLAARAIERARDGRSLSKPELTAIFSETRAALVDDMRQAADELRRELAGETVTFVVNRNINVSNICVVGCAFCGFARGRRSREAYEHDAAEFARRVEAAVDFGATEICIQSGIHPDWRLVDYEGWLRLAKQIAPQIHLHAYSPMEIDHICTTSELAPRSVFERLREAGLGSTPGTAAEVLDDSVRRRISPNKLPVARWVEIVEAAHRSGLRSTATVMFGHIERPSELAEHILVLRGLQERTGGFTELVPLSFVPYHTRLGRTHGIEEISRSEILRHTAAFRLALGAAIPNLQTSWVKIGLDAATEALGWGVNDLGGTLMEESISRMAGADNGTILTPAQLTAAAGAAGRPAAQRDTLYRILETAPGRVSERGRQPAVA